MRSGAYLGGVDRDSDESWGKSGTEREWHCKVRVACAQVSAVSLAPLRKDRRSQINNAQTMRPETDFGRPAAPHQWWHDANSCAGVIPSFPHFPRPPLFVSAPFALLSRQLCLIASTTWMERPNYGRLQLATMFDCNSITFRLGQTT